MIEKKEEMEEKEEKLKEKMTDREKKIYELEKKLGRHDREKDLKKKKDRMLLKYFLIATNMVYTLAGPVLLMLGVYMLLEKFVFKAQQPIVLVILLVIGAFAGYWTLIRQVMDIK